MALYEESLEIKEKVGDLKGKGATLSMMAQVYVTRGDLDRALALYEESLELLEKLGDLKGKAASLHNMAQVYVTRGDLDRALALYEESLELKEKLGDLQGKAASLSMMADLYRGRGDLDQAERLLIESLAIGRKLGQPDGIAFATVKLGQIAAARGQVADARRAYGEGLALFEQLQMPRETAQVRAMLAALDGETDAPDALTLGQALLHLTRAATAARQGRQAASPVVDSLSQVVAQPELHAAAAAYLQALAHALNEDDEAAPIALHEAIDALLAADPLADDAEGPQLWPTLLHNLAGLLAAGQHWSHAADVEAVAIKRMRSLDEDEAVRRGLALMLGNYAAILGYAGQFDDALAAQREAIAIAQALGLDEVAQMQQSLTALEEGRRAQANPSADDVVQLQAQLETLSDEDKALLTRQAEAFAALSPDEQQAVLAAQAQARFDKEAEALEAGLLDAKGTARAAELPDRLQAVAAIWGEGDDPDWHALAKYAGALAAYLDGESPLAVPERYVERFGAFQAQWGGA